MVDFLINNSNELVLTGDIFEAAELLYSGAELLEKYDSSKALEIFKHILNLWESQIESLKMQGQLHQVAEIHLRIAELYKDKFENQKLEKKHILYSIKFLKNESKLLTDFNEVRKLVQNLQNIADLYLKIFNFKKAIQFYEKVIEISKSYNYIELLSFSYQQISLCYEELDNYNKSKHILLDGIDYFTELFQESELKNDFLTLAQVSQILKKLYKCLNDEDQYLNYSKKEASAYVNLAESLKKEEDNYHKIARYYRGAALCYKEVDNNLIESASCYVLAGNYFEIIKEYNESAQNYFDAASLFKDVDNMEMTYKHFVKAGDMFCKAGDVNQSTESYLNAYDIAVEANLEYNRFGIFNQIIRGLHQVARNGLKNKQFYTAATLILESIKFYEQLDIANPVLLREMVRNVYRYYYRAANLKKIGKSHIDHSYFLASLSCILIGQIDKAREIISEIDSKGMTINNFKKIIEIIIQWVSEKKEIDLEKLPYNLKKLIENSEDISYLLNLFKRF